jgi:uncharacterized protein (TIGR02680 family)
MSDSPALLPGITSDATAEVGSESRFVARFERSSGSDRWRPTRAGLVSLWRYWDEVFTFHRGRLLLRGPNGSGKSLALELLLPFLLDADASPNRLTSASKSRGGLYDRIMTGTDESTRVGFAWVEFSRGEETFTVGARLRATQASRRADADFFTTGLAVGRQLHLLDEGRVPLSRQALAEAIGDTGRVHASGEEHRAAVRDVLFPGFSADRYASVIGALLTLRKEKLSQQLVNVEELSHVLSDALPPLDDHDLAAVAEGFERLDRRRSELEALRTELREIRRLANRQRDYARAVVVAGAAAVRSAESGRDRVTRREREATEALDALRQEIGQADRLLAERAARLENIGVDTQALKDSQAYQDGVSLADLQSQAQRLTELAARDGRRADQADVARDSAAEELARADEALASATANAERAGRDLDQAAEPLGAAAVVADATALDEPDEAERLMAAWVEARRGHVVELRRALAAHDRAVQRRTDREAEADKAHQAIEAREEARQVAALALEQATAGYGQAVDDWAARCLVLGVDRVRAAVSGDRSDPAAVAEAVSALRAASQAEAAVAGRDLDRERDAAQAEEADLVRERGRWDRPTLPAPDAPPWRRDRTGLAGARLWMLVDPRPDLPADAIDRLEAALEGAGLLDAWVSPDGRVDLGPDQADVVLTSAPVSGTTLAAVLAPAEVGTGPAPVPSSVVARVLDSLRLVDTALEEDLGGVVAIGRDGSFRLGSAVGRGPQRPARLIGAAARERHRQQRLAEIDAALAAVGARLIDIQRRHQDHERRTQAVRAELAAVPSGQPVHQAGLAVHEAAARLGEARSHLDRVREEVRQLEEEVRGALRTLMSLGARHGLPADAEGLAQIESALGHIAQAAATWARRRRDRRRADRDQQAARRRAEQAQRLATEARSQADAAEREAGLLSERVATLAAAVGAEYQAVLARLGQLEEERAATGRQVEELRRAQPAAHQRLGTLEQTVLRAAEEREKAEAERDAAHRRLVAMVDDLGEDARIQAAEELDGLSAVLAFARAVAADHPDVKADAETVELLSERLREQVHQARTALGARVDIERVLDERTFAPGPFVPERWWVLHTAAGGLRRRVGALTEALAAELERGQAELAAEEEQLFEQTLAGSVRRALATRIRQANALVDSINRQLDGIRTAAAGVRVRLQWDVDPEQHDAVRAARSLLLRDPADLSDVERASLQDFVRARVDQARAELEGNAPWEARLRETLDYRRWHRFVLQVAHRDWDGYQPATARRLQRLSTGERSIALHLPMIASVAAHYTDEGGGPSGCPRLILLDELFAGVDTANRAQLFGTFTAWDLDAVFTSDHEWCQYAALEGIAIHHLHPGAANEPVTSTRFTWDGHQRRIDPAGTAA